MEWVSGKPKFHLIEVEEAHGAGWHGHGWLSGAEQRNVACLGEVLLHAQSGLIRNVAHGFGQVPVEAGQEPEAVLRWQLPQPGERFAEKAACLPSQNFPALKNLY